MESKTAMKNAIRNKHISNLEYSNVDRKMNTCNINIHMVSSGLSIRGSCTDLLSVYDKLVECMISDRPVCLIISRE